jgi:hypothetical protein
LYELRSPNFIRVIIYVLVYLCQMS